MRSSRAFGIEPRRPQAASWAIEAGRTIASSVPASTARRVQRRRTAPGGSSSSTNSRTAGDSGRSSLIVPNGLASTMHRCRACSRSADSTAVVRLDPIPDVSTNQGYERSVCRNMGKGCPAPQRPDRYQATRPDPAGQLPPESMTKRPGTRGPGRVADNNGHLWPARHSLASPVNAAFASARLDVGCLTRGANLPHPARKVSARPAPRPSG